MTPSHDEVLRMAREAGFGFCAGLSHAKELERFAALVAADAAAKERERLFGKERDGDMRLMLHRWEAGTCWAEAQHFHGAQTRFGPSGMLDRAIERMSANIDAAIRARSTKP